MLAKIKSIIVLIIIFLALAGVFYWRGINSAVSKTGEDTLFLVSPGESVSQIGKNLTEANLIKSEFYFKAYIRNNDLEAKLQAGEYVLNSSLSIKKIVQILTGGQAQSEERNIKIIEGWNIREISQYFEREGMFQSEELLELVGFPQVDYRYNKDIPKPKDYAPSFDFLADKPAYYGLEGYLFPDTYRVFKDATLDDIVLKMLNNFDKKLTPEMRADIKKQDKTIYEIVTMASIIEKEVRNEEDMKIVSGIFWDRIKNKQALESCATLAYVLGVNKPQYTTEDTKIDSLYNTYKNRGLPPGPISNPGLKAIKAAIYPTYTDYNYFLSRPDTGETVFSKTYEEHIRNKAKYLK
ncbi:MAG: endolytic transglycosylase MltG [Patescibacteria group bacterium]|nr:endolytic transglycosylase MltG [Patescibacteria group bacterium]